MDTAVLPDRRREERRLRPVDFRAPSKMAREHVRSLELTHELFARRLGSSLTSALRAVTRLELLSISQVTYDEYVRSMPNPTVLTVVTLPPLPSTAVIEVGTRLALTLVDRMLGGIGEPGPMRRPTELETVLLRELMGHATDALADTFEPLTPVQPEIAGLEFNPYFVQTIAPSEMVMVLSYNLAVTQGIRTEGLVTLCYPFATLQPTTDRLTSAAMQEGPPALEASGGASPMATCLPATKVDVHVRLRDTEVPAAELATLNPGDVIRLDHRVDEPVLGVVAGEPLVAGRVGRRGRKLALEVTDWASQ